MHGSVTAMKDRGRRWLAVSSIAMLLALATLGQLHATAQHADDARDCAVCRWIKCTPTAAVAPPGISPPSLCLRIAVDANDASGRAAPARPGCRGPPRAS
jgi:hypothetical protein